MSYLRKNRPSSIVDSSGKKSISLISLVSSSLRHKNNNGRSMTERSLAAAAEAEVDLYNEAGAGTCQIRTSFDTTYDGAVAATGVTFSVQAFGSALDIQALEFAATTLDSSSKVSIYAIKGKTFSTTASDWITLASETTAVLSPDGLGMMTPRAEMQQALSIKPGETWTIYIASSLANIKLASTTTSTGSPFQDDDFMRLNVGESMTDGAAFTASRTENIGFQGKLYYRVLKPCEELSTETDSVFPFATASGTDSTILNETVTTGFNNLLTDQANLKRWTQVYGLTIQNLTLHSKGSLEDCSKYGFQGGCDLFDSNVVFGHFQALDGRDLELECLLQLNFLKGLGAIDNGINVTFIGDKALQQQYDVTMTGIPSTTVLNPIQRDYLQQVTMDFFTEFSESVPNRVMILQSARRRRHLRRRRESSSEGSLSRSGWSRSLEEANNNAVKAQALVYGIGNDHEAFFKVIERAFLSNTQQYQEAVQRQQYLPGEINDEGNLGAIFENITDVSFARSQASNSTISPSTGSSSKDKLDSSQIQIIIFSILIAITFFWLVYRILKDCILVQDGWAVKKEKLSDKVERDNASTLNRPELSNMDKPRQRTSVAIDISSLPEIKLPSSSDDASVPTKASSIRNRRRPPTSRGIGATKSTDDLDLLRPQSNNLSTPVRREPTRGVRRAKSNDDDLLFDSVSTTSNTTPLRNNREPVRGVGKSKSSDFLNLMKWGGGPNSSEPTGGVKTNRSVARSKSSDLMAMGKKSPGAAASSSSAGGGSPTKASKPASAKKKGKKNKISTKPQSGSTIASSSHDKKDGTKKPKTSKKKLHVNNGGEESATPPSSAKVSKKRSEKEKRKVTSAADGTVIKKKKKKIETGDTKEKKTKKVSKSPKRPPVATSTS